MIENKIVNVEGEDYELTHLTPKESIRTLSRILKVIAFPMIRGVEMDSKAAVKAINGMADAEISVQKIADGLKDALDEDAVIQIIESLLKGVRVRKANGFIPANFEVDFHGKLSSLFGVVKEAIMHNYGDMVKKNLPLIAARL